MTVEVWLAGDRGQLLENHADSAYLVSAESLRILWVNKAFEGFSAANGGNPALVQRVVGRELLGFIPDALRDFYADTYARVLARREPARHDYECSSATQTRWFSQYILPEGDRLAIVNTLLHSADRESTAHEPDWSAYEGPGGLVTQCAHCRRLQNRGTGRWELHADGFSTTAAVSHGLCELCFAYFFADEEPLSLASDCRRADASRHRAAFRWLSELA